MVQGASFFLSACSYDIPNAIPVPLVMTFFTLKKGHIIEAWKKNWHDIYIF